MAAVVDAIVKIAVVALVEHLAVFETHPAEKECFDEEETARCEEQSEEQMNKERQRVSPIARRNALIAVMALSLLFRNRNCLCVRVSLRSRKLDFKSTCKVKLRASISGWKRTRTLIFVPITPPKRISNFVAGACVDLFTCKSARMLGFSKM